MNFSEFKSQFPKHVSLVAVSKTKPIEAIQEIYKQGQRLFGENKVQEMCDKYEQLPKDIAWHLIGHLQSNKVKYIASFVQMIHAVDSLKLLQEINKQAAKHNRTISCLLQFHIAQENSKFGMTITEAKALLDNPVFDSLQNVNIAGVMGMATFTNVESQIRQEFQTLRSIFDELKQSHFSLSSSFEVISMGMSGDYQLAIESGSNMVRIGSLIFGERQYTH